MLEAYTWPVAITVISTIITIIIAAYKALAPAKQGIQGETGLPGAQGLQGAHGMNAISFSMTKEVTGKIDELERAQLHQSHQLELLTEALKELKANVNQQAIINKEAYQTTDKKLEKISDLIIELIRN